MSDPAAALAEFVTYVGTHLTGDEKGEAADFLDHLFRALGHAGIKEAGATREYRVAKKGRDSKGKNYIDLLWPERVLFEMKSRGKKLERHYDQIFDYWTHIVPHRPPYVILCNFDEFWIYDFNQQLFDPVDKIALADLPQRASALAFLLPKAGKPLFNNNRVEVTRKAAAKLAELFNSLRQRGEEQARAQRFVLQILVTLVSEDMHLLPDYIFSKLVNECRDAGGNAYDLLGGLFRQMNTEAPARGGRFQGVPYFNGGLFANIDPIELTPAEISTLAEAADFDWSMVKPEIFGTLFQSSMDADERHAFGAHFTSEFDIRKVVGPTIVRPWRERMAAAWDRVGNPDMASDKIQRKKEGLKEVLRDLRLFRVLDPACGSGNFLYIAYREMKRLEREILVRLSEISKGEPLGTAVSIHQFHGLDIQPFAVELAKVTLMLAKEQEVNEATKLLDREGILLPESPLPLDNLDKNILCADALFTTWPQADAIIGNPPYLGARRATVEYGAEYMKRVRKRFHTVPGRADFCVYWFRKAHSCLADGQRAGLVGTNSIRQNYSREGGLDQILAERGTITEAVSSQVWSGDAAVHVSIVNWIKGEDSQPKHLVFQIGDNADSPWETFTLPTINSSLSSGLDVSTAIPLRANSSSSACFQGQTHGHEGFLLALEKGKDLHSQFPDIVHPFLTGDDMLGRRDSTPSRFAIDLNHCSDVFQAKQHSAALEVLRAQEVLKTAQKNADEELNKSGKSVGPRQTHVKRWWRFWRGRAEMMEAIQELPRYVVCVRHTKRPIFQFVSPSIHPNDALQVFPLADDYSFGIFQSPVHFEWFKARCSTLKADFRYTSDTVFDTFPWPQSPTRKQIEAVAKESVALRQLRREVMAKMDWSLRDLYRTLEEPGSNPLRDAQAKLDAAVRAAYAMPKDADILAFLLQLNQTCAAKEAAGESITPPGLPLPKEEHAAFITEDCIEV
ncbi:MAG: DNA methyltransferase [Luteolibacter sp.]